VCACVCSSEEDADGKAAQETSYQQGVVLARLKELESARSDRIVFSSSGPGRKNFYRKNRQKNKWWKDRTQEVVGQEKSLGYRGFAGHTRERSAFRHF
jgi:hypothetical protein